MMLDQRSASEHFRCLLIEMNCNYSAVPYFNANWLEPKELLNKRIYDIEVYKKLIHYGMHISTSTIEDAIILLPRGHSHLFEILVSICPQNHDLNEACGVASSKGNTTFLAILKKFTNVSILY